ncbi:Uncharacterised protein [Actinobacillus seminis]|uniref:Uncharacterized protein n=2 Tax=Actinobacillus seminis TaxID=722 RepID=A0A380VHF1_9PAST|nr:Uncharacterised protein [Actinobacillus seminis]
MNISFFKKHRICCYVFLTPLCLFLLCSYDLIVAEIITPFRCEMWKGKEVEVFLTPQEWRSLSGVNESLKDTEWIYYSSNRAKTDPFFIKNQGVYQPIMYINEKKHWLSSVNSKYPNLNIYSYIYPKTILGQDTFILYDYRLNKIIMKYNFIAGYFKSPLTGLAQRVYCDNEFLDVYSVLKNYLN